MNTLTEKTFKLLDLHAYDLSSYRQNKPIAITIYLRLRLADPASYPAPDLRGSLCNEASNYLSRAYEDYEYSSSSLKDSLNTCAYVLYLLITYLKLMTTISVKQHNNLFIC